ncbi:MAG: DUF4234 domain-containing protein [Oscillospiraceae bacterium]|jgi:Kef-type K+ transport system membrane component KefB|nr:DUF4234 domain-containing protein [Oscillospiraceae bacterium]
MQGQPNPAPVGQLKTNRGFIKIVLLSLVTLGIYGIVFFYGLSGDINAIASRYDGKKTMNFILVAILTPFTLGILTLAWFHGLSARVGTELARRRIDYSFGAGTFWGWCILGALILVGPIVYVSKLCAAMNKLSESYNVYG